MFWWLPVEVFLMHGSVTSYLFSYFSLTLLFNNKFYSSWLPYSLDVGFATQKEMFHSHYFIHINGLLQP